MVNLHRPVHFNNMSERKIDYILAAAAFTRGAATLAGGSNTVGGKEAKLSANVGHEWTDFTEAQLEGRSLDEKLAELEDVIVAVEKLKKRLIAKRNSVYAEAA